MGSLWILFLMTVAGEDECDDPRCKLERRRRRRRRIEGQPADSSSPSPPRPPCEEGDLLYIKVLKTASETIGSAVRRGAREAGLSTVVKEVPYNMCFRNHPIVVASVREPLRRLQSHYAYSNAHRRRVSFDDWYLAVPPRREDDLEAWQAEVGWRGRRVGSVAVDNFMALWLGFDETVGLDRLKKRYAVVFVAERLEDSYAKFFNLLGLDPIPVGPVINRSPGSETRGKADQNVVDLFERRNALDYKIYDLANQALDDEKEGGDCKPPVSSSSQENASRRAGESDGGNLSEVA